ncbi:putative membrane-associated kinase regulator 6 [Senna tora]|uniref:Putative membrane-associated kinase regulator 6 n=1 Tax=Senna tora TaxID=362788 RepID=A0A834T396_9FABA|nr:putative membrane-associated kinase regulator 6 [Senna tora]
METSSQPISIESFSYSWLVNIKPSSTSLEPSNSSSSSSLVDDNNYYNSSSSFIEMDPRMPPSKRFFRSSRKNSQDNFKFDDGDGSSMALVDADELFSNGYLTPLFLNSNLKNKIKKEHHHHHHDQETPPPPPSSSSSSSSNPNNKNSIVVPSSCSSPKGGSSSSSSGVGPTIVVPHSSSSSCSSSSRCPSLKRCRTVSRRVFQKYLNNFLRPLCRRLRGGLNHQKKSSSSSSSSNSSSSSSIHHHNEGVGFKRSCSEISPRISVAYSADEYWRKSCDSESSIYEAVLHCKRSIGI